MYNQAENQSPITYLRRLDLRANTDLLDHLCTNEICHAITKRNLREHTDENCSEATGGICLGLPTIPVGGRG